MKVGDLVRDRTTGVMGVAIHLDVTGGVAGMTGVAVLGASQVYYFPEMRLEVISPCRASLQKG